MLRDLVASTPSARVPVGADIGTPRTGPIDRSWQSDKCLAISRGQERRRHEDQIIPTYRSDARQAGGPESEPNRQGGRGGSSRGAARPVELAADQARGGDGAARTDLRGRCLGRRRRPGTRQTSSSTAPSTPTMRRYSMRSSSRHPLRLHRSLRPLRAEETGATRIDRIYRLIDECRFGVRDISRIEHDPINALPRSICVAGRDSPAKRWAVRVDTFHRGRPHPIDQRRRNGVSRLRRSWTS